MTMALRPHGRQSGSTISVVQGFGHHHSDSRSVMIFQTVSVGAAISLLIDSSNVAASVEGLLFMNYGHR